MTKKKIFAACFYAMFVNGILTLSIGAMIEPMSMRLSITIPTAGLFLVAYAAGNLGSSILSGILPRYMGLKNSVLLLTSASTVAFLGLSYINDFWLCTLLIFLSGIGRGSVSYITNSMINNNSAGRPGPMNILHSFYGIGAVISPFLTAIFIKNGLPYQTVFGIICIFTAIVVAIFSKMDIPNERTKTEPAKGASLKELLKDPIVLVTGALMFVYLGYENGINGWLVTYLFKGGFMDMTTAQSMLSVMWLMIIAGRLICAYASVFLDRKKILLIIISGVTAFFGLFLVSTNVIMLVTAIGGLGLCMGGIYPTSIANAGQKIAGSTVGMSLLLTISGVGGMAFPYISGAISGSYGVTGGMIFLGVGIVILLAIAITNVLIQTRKKA